MELLSGVRNRKMAHVDSFTIIGTTIFIIKNHSFNLDNNYKGDGETRRQTFSFDGTDNNNITIGINLCTIFIIYKLCNILIAANII